ncbi:MAG TPA: hypothetical protein VN281_06310 [Verrucomicrobiae bacterium]|jgi:hypothetical protein|nr:hypothetical protein [Verrucomicrobiae bacterium]
MKAIATVIFFAFVGVMSAQVVLTPTNQHALILSGNTNVLNLSNAVQLISGLKLGMAQTNVEIYMNAHGMTNLGWGVSLDRGRHWTYFYDLPGTDSTLVIETRSRRTGPSLFDWGDPVLESGSIQRLGVDTFLITFTSAP